ncbi:hypothetical protein ONS95_004193 [Cadophora gregata]|uniref:uncharacterized protein n=1 Tax=Cadophora gregata TaxID=51156 RepID=UPI0026DD3926|nr:uncharacterized protein ONS95_004193 [Cadophora gregata]KAK0105666.1 hypothetical protein ONS95_004193 [Cadophora gregata]
MLPRELQIMIWRFALPRFRIIQPILDRGGHDYSFPMYNWPRPPPQDPVLLQVNRQSRYEAIRFFRLRALEKYFVSTSNSIRVPKPLYKPCRYFSPRFDILYFDSILDFELGGYCVRNVLARCDSVLETAMCENIALRLESMPYMIERFFVWLVVWILWFPKVRTMWIVIDDLLDEWKLMKLAKKIRMAAWMAGKCTKERKEDLKELKGRHGEWQVPEVEVVKRKVFESDWWRKSLKSAWPDDAVLKLQDATAESGIKVEGVIVEPDTTHEITSEKCFIKAESKKLEEGTSDKTSKHCYVRIEEIKEEHSTRKEIDEGCYVEIESVKDEEIVIFDE